MNHKQRSAPFTNIGSSSLLVVFLVLCLVTFAVLSLSSARSDDAFSEKLAARKTAYYTAVNRAEGVLSCIDTALEQVPNDNATLTHNERNADQGTLSYATQDTDHTDFTDIDESMDDTDSFDTAQNGNRMVSASAVPSADSTAYDKETATQGPPRDPGLERCRAAGAGRYFPDFHHGSGCRGAFYFLPGAHR